MIKNYRLTIIILMFVFQGCPNKPDNELISESYPGIYPDYIGVTIPVNIAPLNFELKSNPERIEVQISGRKSTITLQSGYKTRIPPGKWKTLLEECKNDSLSVTVTTLNGGRWHRYKSFKWYVSGDEVDPYLSYRLIEPGYEVWNRLSICQRNVTTFDEKVLTNNNLIDGGCINCHTCSSQNPNLSYFHLRHANGGTIIQRNGKLRKIDTRTDSTISAGVYGSWHPGGHYIAFSTNVIIPEFHSINNKRLEVYDTASDIVILDIEKNQIIGNKLIGDKNSFETFPVFSADGNRLYFCSARAVKMPENYRSVRYSLCSIPFYPETGTFGTCVDTVISSFKTGKTVSQPKTSPDGKFILYTSFDYGNFPVWHKEAELRLYNLRTGAVDSLKDVNSSDSESYHSWSSNSRWFVFASKRDDGMYGKPYFAHLNENGICSKPFLLPQKDAGFYEFNLKSFNIPELSKGASQFNPQEVEQAFKSLPAEKVNFVSR